MFSAVGASSSLAASRDEELIARARARAGALAALQNQQQQRGLRLEEEVRKEEAMKSPAPCDGVDEARPLGEVGVASRATTAGLSWRDGLDEGPRRLDWGDQHEIPAGGVESNLQRAEAVMCSDGRAAGNDHSSRGEEMRTYQEGVELGVEEWDSDFVQDSGDFICE